MRSLHRSLDQGDVRIRYKINLAVFKNNTVTDYLFNLEERNEQIILSDVVFNSSPGAQFWRRAGESSGPGTCAAWGCPPGRTLTACWRCWRSPCSRSAPCCIARTTAIAQTLPCSPYCASSSNNVLRAVTCPQISRHRSARLTLAVSRADTSSLSTQHFTDKHIHFTISTSKRSSAVNSVISETKQSWL